MRCFLAIELPDEVRRQLAALQDRLRLRLRGIRWTRTDQIHLTLKFLGEVGDAQLPDVRRLAGRIAANYPPMNLHLQTTGCFPPAGSAHIVWVGMPAPPPHLLDCQRACENGYADLGFPPENRPYHPHLTIGRVNDPRVSRELRAVLQDEQALPADPFATQELVLFQSILASTGPTYHVLARASFGATREQRE